MAHWFRNEARLEVAWRHLIATADALRAGLRVAPPAAPHKALTAEGEEWQ